MKKIYTIVFATLLASAANAQWKNNGDVQSVAPQVRAINNVHEVSPIDNQFRGGGDIWSDDFSTPGNWNTEVLYGDFGWEITDSELGWFWGSTINSISDGNYAFVWNDNPIDNPTPTPGEYNLTTVNPINVSGVDAALLEYNVYGARFTDIFNVQVSTNGVDFYTVGDHSDIPMLTANGGAATANSEVRQYNITVDVQDANLLWIRFNWSGEIAYGWMIDDVRLSTPPSHDVRLVDQWSGDIIFDYEYTMIPAAQSTQPKVVGASFRNMGANVEDVTLDIVITREGDVDPVFEGTSDPLTVLPGELDTIWFDTGFVPLDVDTYHVEYYVAGQGGEDIASDNSGEEEFMVTESLWGNDDYNALTATFNGTLGAGTGTDSEYIMATAFAVYEPGTNFELIQFRLASGTVVGQEIEAALYVFGESEIEPITASFTYYTLQAGDITGDINLAIEDPIELEVGQTYLATIHHFSQDPQLNFRGSAGDNDNSTFLYGPYGAGNAVAWYTFNDFSPAIRLGLDGSIGVSEMSNEEMLQLMQNMPNPFNGATVVPYSLENAGRVSLDVYDMTGKLVMSVQEGVKPAGSHRIDLNAAGLSKGMYFYTINVDGLRKNRKMTIHLY
jgi:hypothetical protein